MSWLPVEQSLPTHRKLRRFARYLKDAPQSIDAQALGHLLPVWLWSIDNCDEDGGLPAEDGWLLEEAALWQGKEGKLVDALCKAGFLRRQEDRLLIAGWDEHQRKILDEREYWRVKKQKQRDAERAKESRGDSPGDSQGDAEQDKTDQTDNPYKINKPDQTEGSASLAFQGEGQAAIEAAASILAQVSFWTESDLQTRLLLNQLSFDCPNIDVAHEVDSWVNYAYDNGIPDNGPAALKGWIKNAIPDDDDPIF